MFSRSRQSNLSMSKMAEVFFLVDVLKAKRQQFDVFRRQPSINGLVIAAYPGFDGAKQFVRKKAIGISIQNVNAVQLRGLYA